MSDPLSAVIETAVARAVAAQIPTIIEQLRAVMHVPPAPQDVLTVEPERFVKLAGVCKRLNAHKTTLYRHIAAGRLPPLERLPSGLGGYRESTLLKILERTADPAAYKLMAPPNTPKATVKAGGRA